ncbi:hypothetical protein [Mycetocola sp. 2940]|uniref:hypothetical protein n=1 Tax=Mycetocola sp. 2940 TaxID=3156452 RepID=UPI00339A28A5
MQISGDYGTELLLRHTEERFLRDLERRRVAAERRAESLTSSPRVSIWARIAAVLGADSGMPAGRAGRGVSQVHAAHR